MNIKICAYVHTSSNIKISYHFVAGSDKIDKNIFHVWWQER